MRRDGRHGAGISIHAPRGGSDAVSEHYLFNKNQFQSTLPVGGATWMQKAFCGSRPYFNPRSPWGERHSFCRPFRAFRLFQSTLPVGGATFCPHWFTFSVLFQSTLPVGGATKLERTTKECAEISIHAPRGGSDHLLRGMPPQGEISIHAPRGGSDPPLWQSCRPVSYFNPRSPWGERP